MNNLLQKWMIWIPEKQKFVSRNSFDYTSSPDLARIYHNYSDAIMACNNHYNAKYGYHCYPIELRMHFNADTLKIAVDK